MITYRTAPAVERIARELIPAHHERLADCAGDIRFLFVDPVPQSKGRAVWGRSRKITGLAAYLIGLPDLGPEMAAERLPGRDFEFFVVEIAEMVWTALDARGRRALVDHELSHLWAGENERGDYVLTTVGHDLEEFRGVVERHGMWRPDVAEFAKTVEQLNLDEAFRAVSATRPPASESTEVDEPVGAGE